MAFKRDHEFNNQQGEAFQREEELMALDNKILEFREAIYEACGHKFVQLLIQMNAEGKIHIDFEFDNPKRWNMGPANYRAMREQLRPVFN